MNDLRLILFDVDGTLVDSQGAIITAMTAAFAGQGVDAPPRETILSIVGLSLDQAMARLAPQMSVDQQAALMAGYKDAYHAGRMAQGAAHSPLYPGARATLEVLQGVPENLLGVATGKSQRGLDGLIEGHGLQAMFVTRQVADHHPSKPHPSMIITAMADCGDQTVMIGDTSYDMDMARAAGVAGIGVSWGYHSRDALGAAHCIIDDFAALPATLADILGT